MKYRTCRKTGDRISEIGLGSSSIMNSSEKDAAAALECAFNGGINYFDMGSGDGNCFPLYGKVLSPVRNQIYYQIHFGADYSNITYGWTLDLEKIKRSVDWQLQNLKTDYIDYAFIHCQDEVEDWNVYKKNGILDYILSLQKSGVVRHVGLSSHTPSVARTILDETNIDMLMFSVNPAYDYGEGDLAYGSVQERMDLYRRCERDGTGISVMKVFSSGQLLNASVSPFNAGLSIYQCIRYALDKPGILTVLPGAKDESEVKQLLDYYNRDESETDYSVLGSFAPAQVFGKCVYCNHCKPCPAGLDIGLINKYYDLSKVGDTLAREHYLTLAKTARDCIGCGHCDNRCPFQVPQSKRMQEIAAYFEE